MGQIHKLSQSIVNKIAAGEVIERPASVVKELMENAVDAGASRIDVSVTAGGSDLIRIVDNGAGIAAGQLPLAVAAHATSKLASADDLFCVATLGFRGEALASIAEISRLAIRSRTAADPAGAEIEVVGGVAGQVAPCGAPPGTAIEVRNLFYNTPVRRKFLKSPQTELGHISEVFTRIALAWRSIHFTLRHNERLVFDLPAAESWLERIAALLGRPIAEAMIPVESVDGPVRLAGYAAHPGQNRSNNRAQYLFLNGRSIRDRSLQHALGEAYRGMLMTGRYPIAVLSLDMPPEMVDVNVHPTKLEVRFQDASRIYSQLLSALRTRFLSTDLTTRVALPAGPDSAAPQGDQPGERIRQQVVDWAKGEVAGWQRGAGSPEPAGAEGSGGPAWGASGGELSLHRLDRDWGDPDRRPAEREEDSAAPRCAALDGYRAPRALQIHNRYLVSESADGVVVIDQHALHERILYEQLRRRVESGPVETQSLLVSEPVDLSPAEAAAAIEHRALLERLGVRIEPFGGDTILVSGYPAMLAGTSASEVLRGLLEPLMSGGKEPQSRDLLDALMHTIACKAAVKAGDRLTPEEIDSLLDQRHLVDDPHHCPHGRPAALVFSREELDRQFKRT
ncbi:MAG: DNA mismatch repair endonuclease MutL [Pirellulales bacterium]|jgi:DNA mismatch repair protein MutL|nr:DNA mismatch repair endonuclease MutL [Thermoguttaceae bacterium]MDD4788207.1 DNA mismatch repair endonuclease MutL [Pirellulales bacterium]NLZ02327.1 DNA mismatch repair endonuclease MutL [Pirellulaceae bacterium]